MFIIAERHKKGAITKLHYPAAVVVSVCNWPFLAKDHQNVRELWDLPINKACACKRGAAAISYGFCEAEVKRVVARKLAIEGEIQEAAVLFDMDGRHAPY